VRVIAEIRIRAAHSADWGCLFNGHQTGLAMVLIRRYTPHMAKTGAERTRRSRAKLHDTGLRPKRIWVSDGRPPTFLREARQQSKLMARSGASIDAMEFMESIAALDDDEG
jgi:hypothetical protein